MSDQPIDLDLPWCFTDEHRAWRKSLRDFCDRAIAPTAAQRNIDAHFDADLMSSLGDLGVYGLLTGRSNGEMAGDMRSFCLTIEELARVDSGVAVSVHVQAISACLFEHLASDEQRREHLPGDGGGNDVRLLRPDRAHRRIRRRQHLDHRPAHRRRLGHQRGRSSSSPTRARRSPASSSSSPPADRLIRRGHPAPRERSAVRRSRRSSCPWTTPGVTVGPSYPKLGWRTSDTHPLYFDDVEVPDSALLGEEGRGYREALRFLTWARLPIASMSVGLAQGCLEETLAFVGSRTSFHQPLGVAAGRGLPGGRHRGQDGHGPDPHLRRRLALRPRPPLRPGGGHLQAGGLRAGQPGGLHRHPAPRRLRLHGRFRRHPPLRRRPHPHHRRGHVARSSASSSPGAWASPSSERQRTLRAGPTPGACGPQADPPDQRDPPGGSRGPRGAWLPGHQPRGGRRPARPGQGVAVPLLRIQRGLVLRRVWARPPKRSSAG